MVLRGRRRFYRGIVTGSVLQQDSTTVDLKLLRAAALLENDPRGAARGAVEILAEYPGHPGATLLLSTARRRLKDPQAAASFAALAAELAAACGSLRRRRAVESSKVAPG